MYNDSSAAWWKKAAASIALLLAFSAVSYSQKKKPARLTYKTFSATVTKAIEKGDEWFGKASLVEYDEAVVYTFGCTKRFPVTALDYLVAAEAAIVQERHSADCHEKENMEKGSR